MLVEEVADHKDEDQRVQEGFFTCSWKNTQILWIIKDDSDDNYDSDLLFRWKS